MRFALGVAALFALIGMVGCTPKPSGIAQPVISGDSAPPAALTSGSTPAPSNPTPTLTSTGSMTPVIYRLQAPFHANSEDSAFWKLVDEDVVDPVTSRRLYINGLRVGRARAADWPQFLEILTNEGAIKTGEGRVLAQFGFGDARPWTPDSIPEEWLFIFDEHGLTMRSFTDCKNEISMAFAWAPRKPKTIRITICPVVVCKTDESLYNLNLTADIAPGEVLILGTSPETKDPNRVGSRFLTRNGPNQRFEELLLVVGEPIPMVPERYPKAHATTR